MKRLQQAWDPSFGSLSTALGPLGNPERQLRWLPAELVGTEPRWSVSCIVPLYAENRFIGMLGLDITVSALFDELRQTIRGEGELAFVIDDVGRPLMVSEPNVSALFGDDVQSRALSLLSSPPGGHSWTPELAAALTRPVSARAEPAIGVLVASMTKQETGVVQLTLPETRLVAYAPLGVARWSLGVVAQEHSSSGISTTARDRIDRASRLYAQLFIACLLFAVALITVLGIWAGRRFSRPIAQMINSIQEVSRGGPFQPLVSKTGDELEILAESANAMVSTIRENEQLLAEIVNGVNEAIFLHDGDTGRVVRVNRHACVMFKCREGDITDCTIARLSSGHEPYTDAHGLEKIRLAMQGPLPPFQWQSRDLEGRVFWTEVSLTCAQIGGKAVVVAVVRDISERIKTEESRLELERNLLQTQKLESLGVMAGGIAHDFNNLLTAILGHTDLVRSELAPDAPAQECLGYVEQAARRAADLCRQMLAYAGRGKLVVEPLELADLMRELLGFLKTAISKKAELRLEIPRSVPMFWGDATQIRQVAMNLVLNASDALQGKTGDITVSVTRQLFDESRLNETLTRERLAPGGYICLQVADNGVGMSAETQQRIFEPFFTTKFTGRGLGLSAVVGIIKGHHGLLLLSSEEGQGTSFTVAFPEASTASLTALPPDEDYLPAIEGTVLVVDDEEPVRRVTKKMLELLGFSCMLASDGQEAVNLYRQNRSEISLIVLDMTMPIMDGEQTLQALQGVDPDVRVILTSGFAEVEIDQRFRDSRLSGILQKPYDIATLKRVLLKAWPRE